MKRQAIYVYTNGGPSGRVFVGKFLKQFQIDYYTANASRYEVSTAPLPCTCDIYHPKFS